MKSESLKINKELNNASKNMCFLVIIRRSLRRQDKLKKLNTHLNPKLTINLLR